jgi:pyoverdine/dityrosine biosynthesis protein Dit1/MFS family permease
MSDIDVPRLPRVQLAVIVVSTFSDAVSMTFIFPFLVFMTSATFTPPLQLTDPLINWYAGLAAAAYPIGQLFSGILYGWLSDRFRTRKRFIQLGLLFNCALFPVFGYYANVKGMFWLLVGLRALQGLCNANIGLLRAANGELCTRTAIAAMSAMTNYQPERHADDDDDDRRFTTVRFDSHASFGTIKQMLLRKGFAYLSVGYSLGLAGGSIIGGSLSNIGPGFLQERVYLLPCLVAAYMSLMCFVLVSCLLNETYVARGKARARSSEQPGVSERSPLLLNEAAAESVSAHAEQAARRSIWRVLRSLDKSVLIVCGVNGLLGLTYNGFSELFPLWTKASAADGGLGFHVLQIGIAHALTGPCAMLYQLFAFRRVVQLVGGVRNMLRANQMLLVVVTILFPLLNYISDTPAALWPLMIGLQAVKAIGFGGSFASLYILVNEASSSVGGATNAGVVNTLGQTLENLGRAIAPAAMGGLYFWTAHYGFPTNPFLPFALLSAFFLVTAMLAGFVRAPDASPLAAPEQLGPRSVAAPLVVNDAGGSDDGELVGRGDANNAVIKAILADVRPDELTFTDSAKAADKRFATFAHGRRNDGAVVIPTLLCGMCIGVHDDDCLFRTIKVVPPFRASGDRGVSSDLAAATAAAATAATATAASVDDNDDDDDEHGERDKEYASVIEGEFNVEALQRQPPVSVALAAAEALESDFTLASEIEVALVHAADVRAHDADMFVSTPLPLVRLKQRAPPVQPALLGESDAVVGKFLRLFESIRFSPPNDQFEAVGKARFVRRLLSFVLPRKRIQMILPAFPCKSPNAVTKTLGTLPDMGEELALLRLDNFCEQVSKFYAPGCELLIMSDGRVFADCVGVPDETVSAYRDALHGLVKTKHISFDALDNHIQADSHDAVRDEMMRQYCTMTPEQLDANIRAAGGNFMVYRGFIKFCEQDRVWDRKLFASHSAIKRECGRIARLMMLRNVAFSNLVKAKYPHMLRLSIHAHDNTTKYAVALVEGLKSLRTPWHNCVVVMRDGTYELMHREECEQRADLRLVEKNGRPWNFQQI